MCFREHLGGMPEYSLGKVTLGLVHILTGPSDAAHRRGLFGSNLINSGCTLELLGNFKNRYIGLTLYQFNQNLYE